LLSSWCICPRHLALAGWITFVKCAIHWGIQPSPSNQVISAWPATPPPHPSHLCRTSRAFIPATHWGRERVAIQGPPGAAWSQASSEYRMQRTLFKAIRSGAACLVFPSSLSGHTGLSLLERQASHSHGQLPVELVACRRPVSSASCFLSQRLWVFPGPTTGYVLSMLVFLCCYI
jgi:hypothetical protein